MITKEQADRLRELAEDRENAMGTFVGASGSRAMDARMRHKAAIVAFNMLLDSLTEKEKTS